MIYESVIYMSHGSMTCGMVSNDSISDNFSPIGLYVFLMCVLMYIICGLYYKGKYDICKVSSWHKS